MNPLFYQVYGELTEHYRRTAAPPAGWHEIWQRRSEVAQLDLLAMQLAAEAVDGAIAAHDLHRRLRPDARHLLLTNVHQMIVLPLLAPATDRDPRELLNGFRQDLLHDVSVVLGRAAAQTGYEDGEISGHAVIAALADTWSELKTVLANVWG